MENENHVRRKEVMTILFDRYIDIISKNEQLFSGLQNRATASSLISLCSEASLNMDDYPFDKINRWLGFVQGVLCAVDIIDVDEERNFTRPLLHSIHDVPIKTFATDNLK